MASTLWHLKNLAPDESLANGHRTGTPVTPTTTTTTTGAGAPAGTGGRAATTTIGVAAPDETRETTSHKAESTAAGEDAQHAKSTQTRKVPKKKSSHAEHYASHEPYARRECQMDSN